MQRLPWVGWGWLGVGVGWEWGKVGNMAKLSPASAGAWAELGNKISMANWHVSPKRKI